MSPEDPVHNVINATRIAGEVVDTRLSDCVHKLLARHPALRTSFPTRHGNPVCVLGKVPDQPLARVDIGTLAPPRREKLLAALIRDLALRPFELRQGPLCQATLVRIGPNDHVLLLVGHGLICGAASLATMTDRIGELYTLLVSDGPLPVWARSESSKIVHASPADPAANWATPWSPTFETLELPTDQPRPRRPDYRTTRLLLRVPKAASAELRRFANTRDCNIAVVLTAVLHYLLHRQTGRDEIRVLVRDPAGQDNIPGKPEIAAEARTEHSHETTFSQLVEQVRGSLASPNTLDLTPRTRVAFAISSTPTPQLRLPDTDSESMHLDIEPSFEDLRLEIGNADPLALSIVYKTELFDRETIDAFAAEFIELLTTLPAGDRQSGTDLQHLLRARRQVIEGDVVGRDRAPDDFTPSS